MDAIDANASVLVLVDYQGRLMPAIDDAQAVAANAVLLARAAHLLGIPVIGTEQNPSGLGPNVEAIRAECAVTLAKTHFDACADGLLRVLRDAKPDVGQVVVAGCEAHVCVLQTVMGLRRLGHDVRLVRDCVGSRRQANRDAALERAAAYGAELVTSEMVVFEWLATSGHPRFKDALQLVK